jgi:hypothetical protein
MGQQRHRHSGAGSHTKRWKSENMEQKYQSEFAWDMVNKVKDRECQFKSQFAAELQSFLVRNEIQESSYEESQESSHEKSQKSSHEKSQESSHEKSQESSHEKSQETFQKNNQESFDDSTEDKKKLFDESNYSYLEGDYPSEKVTINQLRPRNYFFKLQILISTARESNNLLSTFGFKSRLSTISRVETVLSFNHVDGQLKTPSNSLERRPTEKNYSQLQKEVNDLQTKLKEVNKIIIIYMNKFI